MGRATTATWLRRSVAVALVLAVLPLLVALVSEAWISAARPVPRGDQAILELHLRQALHGRHLLGPYSQYGWFHPGPLLYYLMAPLYLVSSGASGSIYFTAGIINLAAVASMVGVHFKVDRDPATRLAFCVILPGCVAALAARVPVGAFVANPLTEIWNPAVTVLPFALLLVTGAAVASGHLELAPLVILLQAFTAQTHVSYVPASTAVLVLALGAGIRWSQARRPDSRWWRRLAPSGAVALLVWLPPLIALLLGQPGNALAVLRFFVTDSHERLATGVALAHGMRELHWPLLTLLQVEGSKATTLAVLLSTVQLAGTVATLRQPIRDEEPYFGRLALLVTIVMLIAVAQATQLMSIERGVYYYQTLWYGVVGCLGWSGCLLVLGRALGGRSQLGAAAVALLLPAVGSAVTLNIVARDFKRCLAQKPSGRERAELVADAVRPLFESNVRKPRYELDAVSPGAWGVLATVALRLNKQGLPVRLAKGWRPMLGSGADYAERSPATLQIALEPLHAAPLWQTIDGIGLYLPRSERAAENARNDSTPACRVLATSRVGGATAGLCDGSTEATGARQTRRAALKLKDPTSTVTVALPPVVEGEFVAGVELETDGYDAYLIEASEDLETYVRLGASPAFNRRGMRWRDFYFNDRVAWKAVRISPLLGDRECALAELRPLVTRGSFAHAVQPTAR